MTLQEAIKSGRPFKREHKCHSYGYYVIHRNGEMFTEDLQSRIPISSTDILNEDWELKPEEPKIPREFWLSIDIDGYDVEHIEVDYIKRKGNTKVVEQLPNHQMLSKEKIINAISYYVDHSMDHQIILDSLGFTDDSE